LILAENIHIVHTFFETADLWGGMVAKLSGGVRLVSSRRDMGILRRPKHALAYRALRPMFDLVLTVSEQVRTFCLEADGLPPRKVQTLYNGIELDRIAAARGTDELRKVLQLENASHVVATVGHVRKIKGVDVYVRAAARVCKDFPRALFLVIGDASEPQYFRELQELAGSQGVGDNVRFLGPSEAVFSILKLCDVFCLPSRSEGFSNALIEAMACGLPSVATRAGGNAEALEDGRSGFLVESEDVAAMAERLQTLLRDPKLARQMGMAAQEAVAERFSARAMIEQLSGIYEGLLDGR
jgi:glycosyltransferase involved in cell wall biosynthesis